MHYLEAETGAPSRERLWSSRPQGTRSAQCADAEVRGAVTDAATVPSEDLSSGLLGLVGRSRKGRRQTRGKGPGKTSWEGETGGGSNWREEERVQGARRAGTWRAA